MDNVNQLGKQIKKSFRESDHNIRRQQENFPNVHRSVDTVAPTSTYKIEFPLSNKKHHVSLNFNVRELTQPCNIEAPDIFVGCEAHCGDVPGSDVAFAPEINPSFNSNLGGFILDPAGGVTVPISGYYNIHYINNPAGVSVGASTITGQIRAGGAVVATETFSQFVLGFFSPTIDLWAVGIFLAAGSNVSGWLNEHDVAFWTPSDFCGLFGGQYLAVTLVGLA